MNTYDFEYAKSYSYASDDNVCLTRDAWAGTEPTHNHNYYEISYIYHGAGVHVINNITYPVEKGTIIFFTKNDHHSFYSLKELSMINCCFKSQKNLNYFPVGDSISIISLSADIMDEVTAIIKTIELELKRKDAHYKFTVQNCLDSLLLILNRHNDKKIAGDPVWGKLLSYVSEHYSTITLHDALSIMNMSKSYFCRKFKNQFSVSFLTYIQQIRIQQAQRLLTTTDLSLTEISERVGYKSLCRFHEDFKKFVKTTPHKYRLNKLPNNV